MHKEANQGSEQVFHENIEKLDKEILVNQNSFLLDELNKYKAVESLKTSELNKHECHCGLKVQEFFTRFRNIFDLFSTQVSALSAHLPVEKSLSSIMEFLRSSFANFGRLAEICSNGHEHAVDLEQVNLSFEKALKGLIDHFDHQAQQSEAFPEKNAYAQRIASLESLNAELMSKLHFNTQELERLKSSSDQIPKLEAKVEDSLWKKHLLEKRINSLRSMLSKKFDHDVKDMYSSPFYYCYCGGKFMESLSLRLSPELHQLLASKSDLIFKSFNYIGHDSIADISHALKNKAQSLAITNSVGSIAPSPDRAHAGEPMQIELPDECPQKLEADQAGLIGSQVPKDQQTSQVNQESASQTESQLREQIKMMQQEIKELIELSEKRRIDKMSILKNIMATSFFKKLMKAHQSNVDHIDFLEKKLEDSYTMLTKIESMRKKELYDLKERHIKDKEKLNFEITSLKREVNAYKQRVENLKEVKESTSCPDTKISNTEQKEVSVVSLQKKLEILIKSVIPSLEEKLKSRDARIKALDDELAKIKALSFDERLLNSEFRHKTHATIFALIREQVNADTVEKMKELEKYVKIREDKIRDLEKTIKSLTKENEGEKKQNATLIEEIARSSEIFVEMQTTITNLKAELSSSNQNFNSFYKEKQYERAQSDNKISEMEISNAEIKNQLGAKVQHVDLMKTRLAEIESTNKALSNQVHDQMILIDDITKQKSDLMNKLAKCDAEVEILTKRIEVQEDSIKKYSSELADSFKQITQKDVLVKHLLKTANKNESGDGNDTGDSSLTNADFAFLQKQDYMLNMMELKKLRVG